MARKLKIMEKEKHPLDDLKNDEMLLLFPKEKVSRARSKGTASTEGL